MRKEKPFPANPRRVPRLVPTVQTSLASAFAIFAYFALSLALLAGWDCHGAEFTGMVNLPGGVRLEMVKIPTGTFMMGSPEHERGRHADEKQHQVTLANDYWIGKYEVTQGQWKAVMGNNPAKFATGDDYPVENVSWHDAKDFCDKLNWLYRNQLQPGYRFDLPTEAQWEYACRASTVSALNNGRNLTSDDDSSGDLDEFGWHWKNSDGFTHKVGSKNPNPWGLYDMHGNVGEFCRDLYEKNYAKDPEFLYGNIGSGRVIRGGDWRTKVAWSRSARRMSIDSSSHNANNGFRLALIVAKPSQEDSAKDQPVIRDAFQALDLGLNWLAKAQENDGRWNALKYQGKCASEPVTALALLAFLSGGNSTNFGKYKHSVRAAQDWLLSRFDPRTKLIGEYRFTTALAMMALAESWGMSDKGNESLRPIVQSLVNLAVEKQGANGGWGYMPFKDPIAAHIDTSVTGWWVWGLKSAATAGANVPEVCRNRAIQYFNTAIYKDPADGGFYSCYNWPFDNDRRRKMHQENMTAASLACLQFLGEDHSPLVGKLAQTLLRNNWIMGQIHGYDGIGDNHKTNYYGWWYQTIGLSKLGTNTIEWKTLQNRMFAILLNLQEKNGFNRGSWSPENGKDPGWGYEQAVGRVGVTATACLILGVYHHFKN